MSAEISSIFASVRQLPATERRAWLDQVHSIRRTGLTLADSVRAAGHPAAATQQEKQS